MSRIFIPIFVVVMAVAGLFTAWAVASKPNPAHKVTICHATQSATNPYVVISVDVASAGAAAGLHGHRNHAADIIPTFTYNGITYQGQGDQSILANGCGNGGDTTDPPGTTTNPPVTTTEPPGTTTTNPCDEDSPEFTNTECCPDAQGNDVPCKPPCSERGDNLNGIPVCPPPPPCPPGFVRQTFGDRVGHIAGSRCVPQHITGETKLAPHRLFRAGSQHHCPEGFVFTNGRCAVPGLW